MSAEPPFAALYKAEYTSAKAVFTISGQWPHQLVGDSIDRSWGKNILEKLAKLVKSVVSKPNTDVAALVKWLQDNAAGYGGLNTVCLAAADNWLSSESHTRESSRQAKGKRPHYEEETESSSRKRVSWETRGQSSKLADPLPREATTLLQARQAHVAALKRELTTIDELVTTTTLAASEKQGQITSAEKKLADFNAAEVEERIAAAGDSMAAFERRRLHHQRYMLAYADVDGEASDAEDIPVYHQEASSAAQRKVSHYAKKHSDIAAALEVDKAKLVEAGLLKEQIPAWKGELATHQNTIFNSRKQRESTALYMASVEFGPEGVGSLSGEDSSVLERVLGVG
ncbi:hypothetical protein ACHAPU_008078 [Fusarium lateritium]